MNSIFEFLYKHLHWLVFLALEIICFVLLFSFNSFQGSVYLSTANRVAARLISGKDRVTSYWGLTEKNEALSAQNTCLQQRVFELETILAQQHLDSLAQTEAVQKIHRSGYRVSPAHVVDKSINKFDNYITIDKGLADGIQPDMGVMSVDGLVGVVYKCTEHYSLVMPLLNSKSRVSCKVHGSDYFGYLNWSGGDARYAMLHDLPRYSDVERGDTIMTSGSSSYFPEGIMVGVVEDKQLSSEGLYVTLKVLLSTHFSKLKHVFVIQKMDAAEFAALEEQLKPGKKKKNK